MNSNYYFSSMDKLDDLIAHSNAFTLQYNHELSNPQLDMWERQTIESLILSEKVFDV